MDKKENQIWSPDSSVRLSASELLPYRNKKAILFFTSGEDIFSEDFSRYDIIELGNYMVNNGIKFYNIFLKPDSGNKNFEYLAEVTGGSSVYIYQAEGLKTVIDAD